MNEHQARLHVKKLRRFYTDILIYTVVNLGLILIWAISGGGTFWPIWVIVGWGIGLGVHAFSLGLLPQIDVMVPFLTTEWEEQEVRRLMKEEKKPKEEKKSKAAEVKIEVTTLKPTVKKKKKTTSFQKNVDDKTKS
ncbi:MAG: 2TM domain-containing protein [Alphaproteobacteria bacterium]|nr:2TM domain-containing protein [Alphaproteobacteria bacterium]